MFEESVIYDDLVDDTLEEIEGLYLEDVEGDWAIAWSGGKDSTAVLGLVTSVIKSLPKEQRNRRVQVIMSDTRVENPILSAYMSDQVSLFNEYAIKHELPMSAEIVYRPIEQSYFVLTLGRGYFLPMRNGQGRWCTGRLKIDPSNARFTDIQPIYKIVGTRSAESSSRARSIDKHRIDHKFAGDAASAESMLYMPIVDWTVDDVWAYLGEDKLGWTSSKPVRDLYEEATGECGVTNPQGVESKAQAMEACGARFGCWLCPVITSDRSTEEMSNTHKWMEPLTVYRELQMKVYGQFIPIRPEGQRRKDRSKVLRHWEAINERVKVITKAGYNRQGRRMKDGQGTLTVEARQYLFDSLLDTEKEVNRIRGDFDLEPIELITDGEIDIIKRIWSDDKANYPHLVTNAADVSMNGLERLIIDEVIE